MFGLGTTELIIIFAIILILFGAGKLPEIGGGLGKAIKNFKGAVSGSEIDASPAGRKDEASKIEGPSADKARS